MVARSYTERGKKCRSQKSWFFLKKKWKKEYSNFEKIERMSCARFDGKFTCEFLQDVPQKKPKQKWVISINQVLYNLATIIESLMIKLIF